MLTLILLWLKSNWKSVIVGVGIFVIILFVFFTFKGCFTPAPLRVDEDSLQKINSQNATERKKELQTLIEDNKEVVRTVDERTTIAETNVIERNREVDQKIVEADKKIEAAKSQGKDVTSEELECILTGVCK